MQVKEMDRWILQLLGLLSVCGLGWALECYHCVKEDTNGGACTSQLRVCDQFQDACTSYVRWAVPPHWTPRGDREYYIYKDCDTRQGCERRQKALSSHCKRDWYNDWACVECCTGDLCNYYVTKFDRYGRLTGAGVSTAPVSAVSLLLCTVVGLWNL